MQFPSENLWEELILVIFKAKKIMKRRLWFKKNNKIKKQNIIIINYT